MAGHSHWANIAYKKAALDKRRGKLWSKIARQIMTAARIGGGNPDANIRLKFTIQAARAANMTNDQIRRVIDKATGASQGDAFEEVLYEGYAPGGAAVLVEALTDNRHRTGGDVRHTFEKFGGNLGATGSVAWQFERRAVVRLAKGAASEDDVMTAVLDAGADDIEDAVEHFVVYGAPDRASQLAVAAQTGGFVVAATEIQFVPKDLVPMDGETARRVAVLLDALEENDDVQRVQTNGAFPEGFEV